MNRLVFIAFSFFILLASGSPAVGQPVPEPYTDEELEELIRRAEDGREGCVEIDLNRIPRIKALHRRIEEYENEISMIDILLQDFTLTHEQRRALYQRRIEMELNIKIAQFELNLAMLPFIWLTPCPIQS